MMHVLIVKHGALGDVVRTSYFAAPLREKWGHDLRLSWLTSEASAPLLRFNPFIDDVWTSFEQARPFSFDHVYSLDDERHVLEGVSSLRAARLTGASLGGGLPLYTDDSAAWFDMGLLSRHGRTRADEMKKSNLRGHGEIFCELFGVPSFRPMFFGNTRLERWASALLSPRRRVVGINPFAGGRWPSKELRPSQLEQLVDRLLNGKTGLGDDVSVLLLGAGSDRRRNLEVACRRPGAAILVPDTEGSVHGLAALVGKVDALVTSDSLAMHLAVAQGVRTVAFFAPTSAAEIDEVGSVRKILSTAEDYCSYRPDACNASITADRIEAELTGLFARP